MLLCYWIARPAMMNATFNTFILPCLGFLFLPFTTLMYVFLTHGVGTIQGLDWLWLFLAVILDIATIGGAGAANRNRIPSGYPGSYPQEYNGGSRARRVDGDSLQRQIKRAARNLTERENRYRTDAAV